MRRISVTKDNKIVLTECTVLSGGQFEKLESAKIRREIENAAKDLKIKWYIESNGNVNILCVTRHYTEEIQDEQIHDLEMASISFLNVVDKLTLEDDTEQASEDSDVRKNEIKIIESVLNDDDVKFAAVAIDQHGPLIEGKTVICRRTLKEMCQAWLEKYANHE